jgi:hypothetical protein
MGWEFSIFVFCVCFGKEGRSLKMMIAERWGQRATQDAEIAESSEGFGWVRGYEFLYELGT